MAVSPSSEAANCLSRDNLRIRIHPSAGCTTRFTSLLLFIYASPDALLDWIFSHILLPVPLIP